MLKTISLLKRSPAVFQFETEEIHAELERVASRALMGTRGVSHALWGWTPNELAQGTDWPFLSIQGRTSPSV